MPEQWYTAYQERNKTLLGLGYASYKDYLASTLWASIRAKVIERDRRSCWVCGFRASNVHHKLYSHDTLTGKSLDYLVALCRDCHNRIEYAENLKLSLHDANNKLDALKVEFVKRYTSPLTDPQSVVKVPRELPSVQSMRKPSKRQIRREKQRKEHTEYLELRKAMLAHKQTIAPIKVIKGEIEREEYVQTSKPRPKKAKRRRTGRKARD